MTEFLVPITANAEATPSYHPKSAIYDPVNNPTGTVIAQIKQLVMDDLTGSRALYTVTAVDELSKQPTFEMAQTLIVEKDAVVRVVSYGNDIHRAYLDRRTQPYSLRLDNRLVFFGSDVASYQLVKNPNSASQEIVSRYYDADGRFSSNFLPMVRVADNVNSWWCSNGHTIAELADGDQLELRVFNSAGALTATAVVFVKPALVLNELPTTAPVITDIRVHASQMRSNGEVYIYERQAVEALNLQVTVTYDDGREVTSPVDNAKVFLFGLENFIASYPGLQQKFLIRWFLADDEAADPSLPQSKKAISVEQSLVVVSNQLATNIKIATIPVWSGAIGKYVLRFFAYSTDRDDVLDITDKVVVTPAFDGTLYGITQTLRLSCDMMALYPQRYSESVPYQQSLVVQLQPMAALQRYTLADAVSAVNIYGVETSLTRRPRLYYDASRQQYFLPSTLFVNAEALLEAFYYKASPPYLAESESGPVVPTHFLLRDPWSGAMITAAAMPLNEFAAAFSILGTPAGRLVGNTVVVEFVKQIDAATQLTLYGVPVDVQEAPSGYLGP